MFTAWGDDGTASDLTDNPTKLKITDSDRDIGGDVQTYNYSTYVDRWEIDYFPANKPYIINIVTLSSTAPIPTLSWQGLLVLVVLMCFAAFIVLKRRRRIAAR
jgi:hypothetical protein